MTPDKVEAALGVMNTMARGCANYADTCVGNKASEWGAAVDQYEEALATLTSALAESERDAARYRWLRDAAHDWDVYYPTDKNASGIGAWLGCTDRDGVIDAAMKDADCELSDVEIDATTDYRGHDPDYDRKDTDHDR